MTMLARSLRAIAWSTLLACGAIGCGAPDASSEPSTRATQSATIAALAAMGNAAPQLKVHIEAGLNVGLSRAEITEILMQMAVYAGFPAALNGLFAAKEVFAARDMAA